MSESLVSLILGSRTVLTPVRLRNSYKLSPIKRLCRIFSLAHSVTRRLLLLLLFLAKLSMKGKSKNIACSGSYPQKRRPHFSHGLLLVSSQK